MDFDGENPMVKKATRLKTSSAKTNLNVKKEEKKKMLFIPKMKERMRRQEEIEMNEQAQPMQDDRMAPPQRFRKHPLSGSDFF